MSERNDDYKQLNIRAPKALYEKFHRLFPAKGEKQTFFLRMIELAVEKGEKWSMTQAVREEVEEKYGR
jgi:predicted DNA-binding protein